MNSTEYKQVIKAHVMKAFARVGKNDQESLARMQILIDDIAERELSAEVIAKAFRHHAETSQFAPTLYDIMQYVNTPNPEEEFLFLARFRKQATSSYPWDEIDDDVFTVKKHIGARHVEHSTMTEWPWIEKQAISIFGLIKSGNLRLQENPNKDRVKVLPSGSRYIEPTAMCSLKDGMSSLKKLLPSLKTPANKELLSEVSK